MHAGDVASRMVEAGNEADLDGVRGQTEDDGNRRGCRLLRKRRLRIA
jgi:hypothetical protein